MVETTDRSIADTNSDVPRVLERGKVTFSTYSAFGALYRATATVTLNNILASSNPIIDCYHYTSGGGTATLNRMNYSSSSSTGTMNYVDNFYMSTDTFNGKTVIKLNFEHIRLDQSTRYAYYIVYSSRFTSEVVF